MFEFCEKCKQMIYEEILPILKSGRLVRRSSWLVGECLGLNDREESRKSDYQYICKFDRYRYPAVYSSWRDLNLGTDILADDWEVVPLIGLDKWDPLRSDVLEVLSEIAQHFQKFHPDLGDEKLLANKFETFAQSAMDAYKTEDPLKVRLAVQTGIEILTTLKNLK